MLTAKHVRGEINPLPSLTVPDKSMTVREIYAKYASGMPVGAMVNTPVYSDQDLPDFRNMDFAEVEAWRRDAKEEIARLRAVQQAEQDKAKADYIAKESERKKADLAEIRRLLDLPEKGSKKDGEAV